MAWGLAIGYLRVRGAQPFPSVVPKAWGLVSGTWRVEGEEDTRTGGRPKPSLALGVPCVRPRVGVRLCRAGVAPSAPVGDRLPLPRFAHALRRRQALCVLIMFGMLALRLQDLS